MYVKHIIRYSGIKCFRSRKNGLHNCEKSGIIIIGLLYTHLIYQAIGFIRRKNMAVSYNNLWKLLIDRNMNKTELRVKTNISSSTMAKLTNQEMVAMPVLEKICAELNCDIGDIMQFVELDEVKERMRANSEEKAKNE